MAVQWLLVGHGLVTLLVVVSFLCGQWPIFQGTFIQRIHNFLTFGAFDYFRRFIEFVFGSRGTNALYLTQYYCCDRPNPILQVCSWPKILDGTRKEILEVREMEPRHQGTSIGKGSDNARICHLDHGGKPQLRK